MMEASAAQVAVAAPENATGAVHLGGGGHQRTRVNSPRGGMAHGMEPANTGDKHAAPVAASAASAPTTMATWSIVVTAVAVDALCPWLQEHVSRNRDFDSSNIVLAEVGTYCIGGMVLAGFTGGSKGLYQCVNPSRYVAFLPSSLFTTCSNIFTYIAVSGLGASQFYLLVQVRVAVLAVMLRLWRGVKQSLLAWLALLQLSLGMIVLVDLRGREEARVSCGDALTVAANAVSPLAAGHPAANRAAAAAAAAVAARAAASAAEEDEDAMSFATSIAALSVVICASSFSLVWMEKQLKAHGHEAVHIQVHQLNFFGFLTALFIKAHRTFSSGGSVVGSGEGVAAATGLILTSAANNATLSENGGSQTVDLAPLRRLAEHEEQDWDYRIIFLFVLLIARGVLTVGMLKKLDSITKGLVDVASIVVCTVLQILVDGLAVDRVALGLQFVLLMSISQYLVANASSPRAGDASGVSQLQLSDTKMQRGISGAARPFFPEEELLSPLAARIKDT